MPHNFCVRPCAYGGGVFMKVCLYEDVLPDDYHTKSGSFPPVRARPRGHEN